ncbi:MAG TPA: alkaline phosphatase family protein [Acetobacteraceae bacterium]|nr:alkaline phosphatase family protein [Acetobacteraceae bacterium]
MTRQKLLLCTTACALVVGALVTGLGTFASRSLAAPASPAGATEPAFSGGPGTADFLPTATPIKHVVVIFDENVSFDHYFATYPTATNPPGEPPFHAFRGTPEVNNLVTANLLTNNPNDLNPGNGAGETNPFRLDRTQANTADQNHGYTAEQRAYDGGKADLFPEFTGAGTPGGPGAFGTTGQVMGYFDGNTATAMWNYAQHFAMSDNAYTDTYGPSTPGALEVVSGQTNGVNVVLNANNSTSFFINDGTGKNTFTLISDVDPANDVCSSTTTTAQMGNSTLQVKNIGDLLNAARIPWGGFMGGFNLSIKNANGTTGCARSTFSTVVGETIKDYVPHHNWLQYFPSTANPTHARPASLQAVGYSFDRNGKPDPANHEYDLLDFYNAVRAGNFPAVSYIKMAAFQDGHPGNSDPLDEQTGVTTLINFLEQQPDWRNTAVIITWDDSDGWYDHAFATPTNASFDQSINPSADQLDGNGVCGTKGTTPQLPGVNGSGLPVNGRCGPGTRLPFLVISPWAKANYVSHTRISQASVVHFIEDNWLKGERLGGGSFDATAGSIMDMFDFSHFGGHNPRLFLNTSTGEPIGF